MAEDHVAHEDGPPLLLDQEGRLRLLPPDTYDRCRLVAHSCTTFQSKLHHFQNVSYVLCYLASLIHDRVNSSCRTVRIFKSRIIVSYGSICSPCFMCTHQFQDVCAICFGHGQLTRNDVNSSVLRIFGYKLTFIYRSICSPYHFWNVC